MSVVWCSRPLRSAWCIRWAAGNQLRSPPACSSIPSVSFRRVSLSKPATVSRISAIISSGFRGAQGTSRLMSTPSSGVLIRHFSTRSCSRPLYSCTVPRTLTALPVSGVSVWGSQFQILQLISPVRSVRFMST